MKICSARRTAAEATETALAPIRVSAYLFGDGEGLLKQAIQDFSGDAGLVRGRKGLFHLPEDLRFAQNHGVEPGRDAEHMLDRFMVGMPVKIGMNVAAVQPVIVAEPFDDLFVVRGLESAVKLGAVAGGDNRCLGYAAAAGYFMQGVDQLVGGERRLLADIDRRCVMIDAKGEQVHAENRVIGAIACDFDPSGSAVKFGAVAAISMR